MAEKKKSIIEEALLDVNRIQEALNANTKEILRSVAIEEIDGLVKESLQEDDYEEEDVEDTDDLALADAGDSESYDDEEAGEEEEGEASMTDYEGEAGMDDMEGSEEISYDGEESGEDYEMDMTTASDSEVISVYKKLSGDDEIEVVSNDEVHIKDPVSGSEYHVKLGGNELEAEPELEEPAMGGLEMGEPELEEPAMGGLEMGGGEEEEDEEEEYVETYTEAVEDGVNEEVVYEIALEEEVSENEEITEETSIGKTANGKLRTATSDVESGKDGAAPNTGDIDGQKAPVGSEKDDNWAGDNLEGGFVEDEATQGGGAHAEHIMKENDEVNEDEEVTETEEVSESDETVNEDEIDETKYVGGKVQKVATAHTNKKLEESVKKYKAESAKLKKENGEFRGALKKFRQMLGETVVFNTNLTNVTRLFTEHSTTKEEKLAIIARFDEEVNTIKESKRLCKTIGKELASKKPISESVEQKIQKEGSSSVSQQLNENTAYVDQSTSRIMDLINRVEKR